jgi:transcriptional regulator with XRE-family HTH domain
MTHENIGHRIKLIRCAKGLSQEELARRVDLTRTAITKIESGSQDVRFRELEKLSEALGISLGNLVEERRPVKESSDDEFFRVCESPALSYQPYAEEKLRIILLVILERCAGDPGMDEQRLGRVVQQADQACFQANGETISGIPYLSPHLQQTISEAVERMTSGQELMRIENRDGKAARHLPLVKADLWRLNAADYIIIEKAICVVLA